MATTGMSCIAIVACLMLHFAAQSIDAVDFNFDFNSCDSLLPNTDALTQGRQNVPNKESLPDDVFPKTDRKSPQNGQQSLLVASHEEPPYNISVSRQGTDDLFTVTLDGGEFNGFIIQARDLQSSKGLSEVSGSFIDPPPGVKILECGTGGSFSSDNTAISTETSLKKSVKLTWKSQTGHVKNMVFAATFVKNNTYWPNVKSNPLLLIVNPPDFKICGTAISCYRYSRTSGACTGEECSFVFITEFGVDQVAFTVGGRFTEPTGYIGVAFTNEKFGKLELLACVLETKDQPKIGHYVANDIESQPEEKLESLITMKTSFNHTAQHAWCRFQRYLQIPGSQLSDFTQPQTMMFLRGPLTNNSGGILVPQLGKSSVFAENPWNNMAMVDELVTVDGVSRGEPGMCLILVSLMVTFFFTAANHK